MSDTSIDTSLAYGEHAFDCHHCGKAIDLREHNNRAPQFCPHCGRSLLQGSSTSLSVDPVGGNTDELKSPIGAQITSPSRMSAEDHDIALSLALGIDLSDEVEKPSGQQSATQDAPLGSSVPLSVKLEGTQPVAPEDILSSKSLPGPEERIGPVAGDPFAGMTTPSVEAVPDDASMFSGEDIEMPWDEEEDDPAMAGASVSVGALPDGMLPQANPATAELDEGDIVDLENTLQKLRDEAPHQDSSGNDDDIELPFASPAARSPHHATAARAPLASRVAVSPRLTPVPGASDLVARMTELNRTEPGPSPVASAKPQPPPPPRSADSLAAPPFGGEEIPLQTSPAQESTPELAAVLAKVTELSEMVEQRLQVLHKGNSALNSRLEALEARLRAQGILDDPGAPRGLPSLQLGISNPSTGQQQPVSPLPVSPQPVSSQAPAPTYPPLDHFDQFDTAPPPRDFSAPPRTSGVWVPVLLLFVVLVGFGVFVLPKLLSKPGSSKPSARQDVRTPARALPRLPAVQARPEVPAALDAGSGQAIPAIPQRREPTTREPIREPARPAPPRRVTPRRRAVPRRRATPRPPRRPRKVRRRPAPRRLARPAPPPRRVKVVVVPTPPRRRAPTFSLPNISMSLPLARRCDICARKLYASTFRKLSRSQQLKYFELCNKACNKNWPLFQKRFYHWCKFRNLGDSSKCPAALKRKQSLYQYQIWLYP